MLASMLASMHALVWTVPLKYMGSFLFAGARERAREHAREHARELFQKNEHVHSFQNAREHARELFLFLAQISQSQQLY